MAAAVRHVFDIKEDGRINYPTSTDGKSDDGMVASVRSVASTQYLELAKNICTDMWTPPNFEILRSFYQNINGFSSKLYKEENNSNIKFIFKIARYSSPVPSCGDFSDRHITRLSMDVDFDLS